MENNQGNKLGKKIKKLRTGLGLSQDELARKADVPYTTLTKIETGVIKKPSVYVVAKIAKALNITIEELINSK
ncbi:helix-turn-helix domain-containing protein [Hippea maritima]|uniref:Helix-turn-helix domain protein n=1 Tax=Hippea maritima (strain ATCC 700847 / DSM 10411 / MH2) TaxID=760142 RepID=F2LVL4_HIPMA|nr:helix-turn-helix transcriptional regulator [Hippea maritima]AEA33798.1 helix-turn-helix domain protein [Hippea maritima DSM 10411]